MKIYSFLAALICGLLLAAMITGAFWAGNRYRKTSIVCPENRIEEEEYADLSPYTIEILANTWVIEGEIELVEEIEERDKCISYKFSHSFDPTLEYKDPAKVRRVTGIINKPKSTEKGGAVLMIRGYVDQLIYESGMGTERAAEVFCDNGYITIAPDYLGYGGSDSEAGNIFETRFQTYSTTLSVLAAMQSIQQWDNKNLYIWGHSNGGQIALTLLTITETTYPTSLWAPVSKGFPYNVLFYTDESDDGGKLIRSELAKLEEKYDSRKFSFREYTDRIKAPIIIHQGTGDTSVPAGWSREIYNMLANREDVETKLYEYQGADHNLVPNWSEVVKRDLEFFGEFHINY